MQNEICGKVYVVADNVDTDQIIPAEYLSYNPSDPEERKYFGRYAMSGVPSPDSGLPQGNVVFTAPESFESEFRVIIGGENFGCGSSREHAPLAISEAGVKVIIAQGYARIFYRNCINGGYCAPLVSKVRLVEKFQTGQEVAVNLSAGTLTNVTTGDVYELESLGDAADILTAGGVFDYARQSGMLKS